MQKEKTETEGTGGSQYEHDLMPQGIEGETGSNFDVVINICAWKLRKDFQLELICLGQMANGQ